MRRRRANAAAGQKRSKRYPVTVTPTEAAELEAKAAAAGMTVPRLLHESAKSAHVETSTERKAAIAELFSIRREGCGVRGRLRPVAGDGGTMRDDMVALVGGGYRMGSGFYPEEGPVHEEWVQPFELDRHAVTNADFVEFVVATGYVTTAEQPLDPAMFPGSELTSLEPGALVFTPTSGPVDLQDWRQWWRWVPGANWRHPYGPDSTVDGRRDHPVVQVAYADAVAFAAWAGKRLPTEAEWEYAARGGLDQKMFSWGDEPNGGMRANSWQGRFPYLNSGAGIGSWIGSAPVGSFPANGFGLQEMTANTWEWTSTWWTDRLQDPATTCMCSPDSGRAGSVAPGDVTARHVIKGGSHLCAPEYCLRYRPAARSAQTEDSSTTHLGFRRAR